MKNLMLFIRKNLCKYSHHPPLIRLILLAYFSGSSLCFSQNKIIEKIQILNNSGNYQESLKQILKYRDKDFDTSSSNYLLSYADYYCIDQNPEYDPYKAIWLINKINCEQILSESSEYYFKNSQECLTLVKAKKDTYVKLYYESVLKSNNIRVLKSFAEEFSSYTALSSRISDRIAEIIFLNAKNSKSKDALNKFKNEFPNSYYVYEALSIIEELDYKTAVASNTIESYTLFLKTYPRSTFNVIITSNLEPLAWEKSLMTNTKESFLSFIKDFPNSKKLPEAKLKINSFVDIVNLANYNAATTLFHDEKVFYKSSKKFRLLSISNNGKIGLASSLYPQDILNNTAYLVNLLDGVDFFRFSFDAPGYSCFSSNDSLLFYCDNNFLKQLDLTSLEITVLFELKKFTGSQSFYRLFQDDNNVHFMAGQTNSYYPDLYTLNHYTYNPRTAETKSKLSILDLRCANCRDIKSDFELIPGDTKQKMLMLKLIHGNGIRIQPLTRDSENSFIILQFPQVYIVENGRFTLDKRIRLTKPSKTLPGIHENIDISPDIYGDYNNLRVFQFSKNHSIVFSVKTSWGNSKGSDNSIFILELNQEANSEFSVGDEEITVENIALNHGDLTEEIPFSGDLIFAHLDESEGNLIYQTSDYRGPSDVYEYTRKMYDFEWIMGNYMSMDLTSMDEYLSNFYDSHINKSILKNMPFESNTEKYLRIKEIDSTIKPILISKRDSLYYFVNQRIIDSIKVIKFNPRNIFNIQHYNEETETWRLVFDNPFSGKDFSIFYPLSKPESKLYLENKYANFDIKVSFYFNLISWDYEPLLLSITDVNSNLEKKFIIPFKDESLLNNLALTSNVYLTYFGYRYEGSWDLNRKLTQHKINDWDGDNTFRYLVQNGKPKNYFAYGNEFEQRTVVQNLDDLNLNYVLNTFKGCCPFHPDNDFEYLRFNEVPYFISSSQYGPYDRLETSVFEISNLNSMGLQDVLTYPSGVSPNGKYQVDINGVFKFGTGIILNLKNAKGAVYWDCNSDYFGIGSDVFPISLIEKVLE